MGTITLTLENVETDIGGRLDLFVEFAGGTKDDELESVYDTTTDTFEVPNVTDQDLQGVFDNWATLYANWQATVGSSTIEELREAGATTVDNYAGETRMRFITVAPGQDMTYMEKADEAADYIAAGYPADLALYPFIQAEVNATGMTSTEAADAIVAQKAAWIAIGSEIEQYRMSAKTQLATAANETQIDSIVSSAKSLLDSVGT